MAATSTTSPWPPKMSAGEVSATLVMLELKNLARRLPGGFFERLA